MMINSDCDRMRLRLHPPQKINQSFADTSLKQPPEDLGGGKRAAEVPKGPWPCEFNFPNTLAIEVYPYVRGQSMQNQFRISKCLPPGKLTSPYG